MDDDQLTARVRAVLGELYPEPEAGAAARRRRRPSPLVLAGVAAVTIFALSILRPPPRSTPAVASAAPVSLHAVTDGVACPGVSAKPVSTAALKAFAAVAALSCSDERRVYPGDGEWQVVVRRGSTAIGRLHAAYELPGRRAKTTICEASLVVLPRVVFVDRAGRAVLAAAPVDSCHKPLSEVRTALREQTWTTLSVAKVTQTKSAAEAANADAAKAAGCTDEWKNLFTFGGRSGEGGPVFADQSGDLHACLYRVDPAERGVGTFERAVRLDASQSARLRAALAGAGPSGACAPQQEFAVVWSERGGYVMVELGGCWRVLRATGSIGTADRAVIRSLLL